MSELEEPELVECGECDGLGVLDAARGSFDPAEDCAKCQGRGLLDTRPPRLAPLCPFTRDVVAKCECAACKLLNEPPERTL